MASKLYDVLVIGGGPAGLSVATSLARQLHTAIVLDSGVYRNARAKHMHSVPGWDHANPADFRAKIREDLLRRYQTIEFQSATISQIKKLESGSFQATDDQGNVYNGRKVGLATGIKDIMPNIEGYDECWGRGIFHCLFCHGYEERGADSAGVLATGMMADPMIGLHVGNMVLRLAKNLTFYTNGNEQLAKEIKSSMPKPRSRIKFDTRRIKKLEMASRDSSVVLMTFEDGIQWSEAFLSNLPQVGLNCPFVQQLGLELGPQGEVKTTAPFNETSMPGVFAAGDAATAIRAIPSALAMGGMVGAGLCAQLQADLALEED